MATANRHRSGMRFPSTMIKDDLEEGNSDFTTHCDYTVKVDSASIINILGLLKHAIFIDANKTWDDSYVCGKWNGYICRKSTLFNFFLPKRSSVIGLVKVKFIWKFCVVCFVTDSKTIDKKWNTSTKQRFCFLILFFLTPEKISNLFRGYRKGGLKLVNLSVGKYSFHKSLDRVCIIVYQKYNFRQKDIFWVEECQRRGCDSADANFANFFVCLMS